MRAARFFVLVALVAATQSFGPPRMASASSAQLVTELDDLVRAFPGGAGIWVADPALAQPVFAADPDREFVAASLYKLGILVEAERRVEARTSSYADPVTIEPEDITEDGSFEAAGTTISLDDALEAMITVSDNGTALALWRLLGAVNINATLARAGMEGLHVALSDEEDNVATPRAVGTLFTLLARRQLISPAASDRMLARLERQRINDRLPSQLPAGVVVAHKTGNLSGVTHDAGVIFTASGPRVVVALTREAAEEDADRFIGTVGSIVYAAVLEPPANARYEVPRAPVPAVAGESVVVRVRVTNAGRERWAGNGGSAVGLVYEVRDAKKEIVDRSAAPLALGALLPQSAIDVPLGLVAPSPAGDYTVTLGLADEAGRGLAALGAATASFTLRTHNVFVASTQVQLPALLHRGEASLVTVGYSAAPGLAGTHVLSLGWRAVDPATAHVAAEGATALGSLQPGASGTFFAAFVAPAIRGTYRMDYELRENGAAVGETSSKTVNIAQARTFPDERDFGPRRPAAASPRPTATAPRRTP